MKKSTAFGAVLCSAALACSMAAPAFAAGASVGADGGVEDATKTTETNKDGYTGSVATEVSGMAIQGTINVAIPLKVSVVMTQEGGAITAPESTAYRIKNNGKSAVNITKVTAAAGTQWVLPTTLGGTATVPNASSEKTKIGALDLTLNGKVVSAPTTKPEEGFAGAGGLGSIIPGGELGLTLAGTATPASPDGTAAGTFEAGTSTLLTLTYTVSNVVDVPASGGAGA